MPPLIIGLAAIGFATGAGIAGVIGVTTAIEIGLLGVSMLVSYFTAPKAQTVTMQAIARQAVSYRRIIYGAVRASGVMTYIGVSGSNNEYLHMVITLAGHQVQAITNAYIEGFVATQGNAMNGTSYPYYQYEVDLGVPSNTSQPFPDLAAAISSWDSTCLQRGCAKVHIALQYNVNVYPNGVPSSIAFDVQGKLLFDPRTSTTAYSDNPALVVRDWLTDTKFGMGASASQIDDSYTVAAANICDQSVSVSSGNVATFGTCTSVSVVNGLCGITCGSTNVKVGAEVSLSGFTYATFLNGVTAYVVALNGTGTGFYIATANANYSHGSDTGTASAPSTQKRYLCDGVTDAGQARGDVLRSLLTSMAGYCIPPGDAWRIIAGAYYTPTIILGEDDIRGPIKMDTLTSLRNLANGITGTFVSPANNWQDSSFPPYQDATALAADGNQPIWQDIQLPFTTDGVMTQRLAKIYLERIRRQKSLVLPCKLSAFPLQPGDNVMFTFPLFGFTQKVFEVQQCSIVLDTAATQIQFGVGQPGNNGDMTSGNQAYSNQVPCVGVDLTLKEIDANVFAWNPATDENTWLGPKLGAAPPNPTVCQPPTSVTATSGSGTASIRADGLISDRILVQWTSPADSFVTAGGSIEIYTSPHSAGTWSLQGTAAGDDTQFYILNVVDGTAYDVLVYAVNVVGVSSAGVQVNNITASGGTTNFGGSVSSIPAGQIAALTTLAPYNAGTAYTPGMEVTYAGNMYKCILSTTGNVPTNTTYWVLIGPQTADNLGDGTSYIRLPVLGTSLSANSTDLPYNGNFDIFPSTVSVAQGWTQSFETAGSDVTYSRSSSPYSGTYAQQLGPSSSANGGSFVCQPFGVTAGLQYSFSVWAKSTVANPGSMYFRIVWYSNDADFSRSAADVISFNDIVAAGGPTASNNYQQFSGTITAPSTARYARVALYNWQAASGPTLTFSAVRVFAPTPTLGQIVDGPQNFSATASTLSYCPTTNPLTADDAGSNATVNIASFTMRTSSKGDISISGGSITGLSYKMLYYIYYSDPTLAGGSVTMNAATSKTTAIDGTGYFFVGSIYTPAATAPNTNGNNDGGCGAQTGQTNVFLFGLNTVVDSGSIPAFGAGNLGNAYDGDLTTYAILEILNTNSLAAGGTMTLTGASPTSAPWSSLTLYVRSSVPTNTYTGSGPKLGYSLNGGGSFSTIFAITGATTRALTTDSVSLPFNTNLGALQVQASVARNNSTAEVETIYLYEAWVVGII